MSSLHILDQMHEDMAFLNMCDLHFYANPYDNILLLSNHIFPEKALDRSV